MTNDHCDLNDFERAHFVARGPTGLVFRDLIEKEFSVRGRKSGVGRDLAIWRLDRSITELPSLKVSRQIPLHLDRVVTFKVDPEQEGQFTQFQIVRRECQTRPHVPVLAVGFEDRAIGLSLHDCDVRKGNSGAPVFAMDGLNTIQVVINSVWTMIPGEGRVLADLLGLWFLGPLPESLRGVFAMGERVHCLPVSGQPAPDILCGVNEGVRNQMAAGRQEFLQKEYPQRPGPGVAWGFRLVDLVFTAEGSAPKFAIALLPYPVCQSEGVGPVSIQPPPLRYYQIGFDENGRFAAVEVERRQLSDVRALLRSPLGPRFRFARGEGENWKKWLQLPARLPACQEVYERSRAEAVDEAERFYLFDGPSLQPSGSTLGPRIKSPL